MGEEDQSQQEIDKLACVRTKNSKKINGRRKLRETKNVANISCNTCKRKFGSESALKDHQKATHHKQEITSQKVRDRNSQGTNTGGVFQPKPPRRATGEIDTEMQFIYIPFTRRKGKPICPFCKVPFGIGKNLYGMTVLACKRCNYKDGTPAGIEEARKIKAELDQQNKKRIEIQRQIRNKKLKERADKSDLKKSAEAEEKARKREAEELRIKAINYVNKSDSESPINIRYAPEKPKTYEEIQREMKWMHSHDA